MQLPSSPLTEHTWRASARSRYRASCELVASPRRFARSIAPLLALAALLAALGGGAGCLPTDTRPAPGSILLTVKSADEPSVTTVDGWSIAVDRLLVGLGEAALMYPCDAYSEFEDGYTRLLDGRLAKDQKIVIIYGLGQCDFSFQMFWPSAESLLGEGVNEADRDRMAGDQLRERNPNGQGIVVDFAATATRGGVTKRVHWLFAQPNTYIPCTRGTPDNPQSIELRSDEHLTLPFGIRGVALFSDDQSRDAALRFDPVAAADTQFGNADDEVTLSELDHVSIEFARQFGPYLGAPPAYPGQRDPPGFPASLRSYIHLVLLRNLVVFPEGITCGATLGIGRPPR